ncbi:hypothetical protein TcasGA2_TC005234 [Tribolium castaneum]|uniref:Uncharacterized protein n=1 Tax=Tribolium castaneum TaxID=7070 RepID=D6WC37_TRICA|nr:PREDICTED: uncharacterized protein LOC103313012 [Tribolium castaneum]EEZ99127.1 hypothetical protein TcasGA2_TC005234 [Tribolium castaneum]|eukprot:XP_015837711.1 PREDICTED: uncharacterized protein LOC103313012 [Tribolium castaneum]
MKFVIICAVIAGVAARPQQPIYSSRYATVYYQGSVSDKQVPQYEESTETFQTTTQIKDRQNDAVKDKLSEAVEVEGLKEEAVYYIYHPGGPLQRVVYLARDDPQNMAYTAQFKYENVEPIKEPIYTYDPQTFVLQQLQR